MQQIRILNAEPEAYSAEARTILEQLGEVVEATPGRAELLALLPNYDVLIVRLKQRIDREAIDRGARLQAIVTATTGLDHIDVDYAARRGVQVLSLRGEHEFLRGVSATSEHTWALLLALVRRIPQAAASVRGGEWNRNLFRGRELKGQRLGVVGLGRIGRKVTGYGLAFGMEVAAYNPDATEWMEGVKRAATLADLLRHSDVLSLHAPLDAESRGMIGERELALLPPGAVLINTARGALVNEAALLRALESGHLAGAALDVIEHEHAPVERQQSALLAYAATHDNLLITPHIGGATCESMSKTEVFMARKLASFLQNGK